eukprot:PhM_4_TR18067/c0_g1_i1/m.78335
MVVPGSSRIEARSLEASCALALFALFQRQVLRDSEINKTRENENDTIATEEWLLSLTGGVGHIYPSNDSGNVLDLSHDKERGEPVLRLWGSPVKDVISAARDSLLDDAAAFSILIRGRHVSNKSKCAMKLPFTSRSPTLCRLTYAFMFPSTSALSSSSGGCLPGLFCENGVFQFGLTWSPQHGRVLGRVVLPEPCSATSHRQSAHTLRTPSVATVPGRWMDVDLRVRVNTCGRADGSVCVLLDGVELGHFCGLRCRSKETEEPDLMKVDGVLFYVFENNVSANPSNDREGESDDDRSVLVRDVHVHFN